MGERPRTALNSSGLEEALEARGRTRVTTRSRGAGAARGGHDRSGTRPRGQVRPRGVPRLAAGPEARDGASALGPAAAAGPLTRRVPSPRLRRGWRGPARPRRPRAGPHRARGSSGSGDPGKLDSRGVSRLAPSGHRHETGPARGLSGGGVPPGSVKPRGRLAGADKGFRQADLGPH